MDKKQLYLVRAGAAVAGPDILNDTNGEIFTASSQCKIFTTRRSCGERQMCRDLCDIPGWLLLRQGMSEVIMRSRKEPGGAKCGSPGHLATS